MSTLASLTGSQGHQTSRQDGPGTTNGRRLVLWDGSVPRPLKSAPDAIADHLANLLKTQAKRGTRSHKLEFLQDGGF